MLRHPFYLLLCLFAVVYLAVAGVRGWSVWHTLGRSFIYSGAGRGASGGFHHK
jgi:hypothetical protein